MAHQGGKDIKVMEALNFVTCGEDLPNQFSNFFTSLILCLF